MACWQRVHRVSVNDVFVCEVRCDEGAYLWTLTDCSYITPQTIAWGDGPVPSCHLPLGTSLDGVPWIERVPHWVDEIPSVRASWPTGKPQDAPDAAQ